MRKLKKINCGFCHRESNVKSSYRFKGIYVCYRCKTKASRELRNYKIAYSLKEDKPKMSKATIFLIQESLKNIKNSYVPRHKTKPNGNKDFI